MSYHARKALAQIDIFAGLPEDVLNELVQRGTTLTLAAGQRVVEQGAIDAGLQVVLEGSADVSVNGVTRHSLEPGSYFGEISMIDGLPRSASIAAGPNGLTTFALSTLAFAPMLGRPEVSRVLMQALCARLREVEAASRA